MNSQSHTTTDHDEIRRWAEKRGGAPAHVRDTARDKDDAGILRIAFAGDDKQLQSITWEDWFEKFDDANLAFLYQDRTADGDESRFFKLVSR
ncbi:MAG TPA: hypothetical protein VFL78_00380 [Rhodanobacteraceae bacterium]|nr:hypothetical protein [Rhodanobacteraceae bacterium]